MELLEALAAALGTTSLPSLNLLFADGSGFPVRNMDVGGKGQHVVKCTLLNPTVSSSGTERERLKEVTVQDKCSHRLSGSRRIP